jgi:hypothetical protein
MRYLSLLRRYHDNNKCDRHKSTWTQALNKHLILELRFSPNFSLNSVADCPGKCDVGGFLIFERIIIRHSEAGFKLTCDSRTCCHGNGAIEKDDTYWWLTCRTKIATHLRCTTYLRPWLEIGPSNTDSVFDQTFKCHIKFVLWIFWYVMISAKISALLKMLINMI